jgi:peptidoglycan hydrolase-like protein with peptidoglycan-binding domain
MQRSLALAALLCAAGAAVTAASAVADDPFKPVGGGATAAQSDVVLKKGDRGPAVETLQRALGVGADGVFGKLTARAVKRFQRGKGLTVDGIVGPQTRDALGLRPFSARAVTRRGTRQAVTRAVHLPRVLRRIAECESGGDPTAISPGGTYRGKYQFHRDTWAALGGSGDPADAPEVVQDRLALKLYKQQGTTPWPSCGA